MLQFTIFVTYFIFSNIMTQFGLLYKLCACVHLIPCYSLLFNLNIYYMSTLFDFELFKCVCLPNTGQPTV